LAPIVVVAALLGFAPTPLNAQAPAQPSAKASEQQPNAKPPPSTERPPIPDPTKLTLLIQSYLVALSQANLTGNYAVLHALGAPAFQENNPPDKLFQIFANMRSQGVDLTPVLLYKPILSRKAAYDEQGLLHLIGYYKTEPQQVHFDVTLQPVGGLWRLFGISVKTVPSQAVTSAPPTAPAPSNATPPSKAAKGSPAKNESTVKKPSPQKQPLADNPSNGGTDN
jgi:hypothetical protein